MNTKRLLPDILRSTQTIHPDHVYRNIITQERIRVCSVGPQVLIERQDAKRNEQVSVPVDTFRRGIESNFIVHEDTDRERH